MEKIDYISLDIEQGEFTKQSRRYIENMLQVWDGGHGIYICHPNHIFVNKPVNGNSRDIFEIDWQDIDVERMLQISDAKYFANELDIKSSFTYVHNRIKHEMLRLIKLKREAEAIRHLVVLEQDFRKLHLVRGIIRGNIKGYSVAFNPFYLSTIPQSIWERSLRLSEDNDPEYGFSKILLKD